VKSHLNQIVVGCFILAVVILGLIALTTYQATTGLVRATQLVTHTREVLENLEALFSGIIEAETGERGYVITGEEAFLQPYTAALDEIDFHLKRVTFLTADNPQQQALVARLQPLIRSRLDLLKSNIALRSTAGFDSARQRIAGGDGKRATREIGAIITGMKDREEMLLTEHGEEAASRARNAFHFLWLGAAVSILLMVLCFQLLRREIAGRLRAEAEVSALNEKLRQNASGA
jgi:methyl-accepting chemotaxis protein